MGAVLACLGTSALANCASCLLCCCSSAACSFCCTKTTSLTSSTATRFAYALFFLFITVFAWTMETGWVNDMLEGVPFWEVQCPEGRCSGQLAVFRVMASLVIFHLVLALVMIGVKSSKDPRAGLQNGWWGPKFIIWFGLMVAAFFIPNDAFHYYGIVSFGGAIGFLFIQLVLLIDFAAAWSERWVANYEESESKLWMVLLFGVSGSLIVGIVVIAILLYVFFTPSPGCGLNTFFITFHLLLTIVACGLSIHPKIQEAKPNSGLLQAAIVSMYATYLLTSGISGEPSAEDDNCNPFAQTGIQTTSTVLGTIFTFIAIVYSTTRAAAKGVMMQSQQVAPEVVSAAEDAVPLLAAEQPAPTATTSMVDSFPGAPITTAPSSSAAMQPNATAEEDAEARRRRLMAEAVEAGSLPKSALADIEAGATPAAADEDDDEEQEEKDHKRGAHTPQDDEKHGTMYSYSYFHVVFCLACMYVSMLLSRWNTVDAATGELVDVGHDWASVWVKIVSGWATFILFTWTLVAPLLFPDREWM